MKGVVFVKLNEFVEETWGMELWDEILTTTQLSSEGIYTTVGNYDDKELFDIVEILSQKLSISADEAQKAFGQWIFKELYALAPPGVHDFVDVFAFLRAVQDVIHVEVKKLNPDVLLPEFKFLDESESSLTFQYISPRNMCQFCEGIVLGLSVHTKQTVGVTHLSCEHKGDDQCVLKVELV